MEQHSFLQGSAEWHQHRATHFNASDAPVMLGISPYKTRTQLLDEMATGIVPEVDSATQRRFDDGHRFEALARPLAEKIIGRALYPVIGSEGKLSASFDGLTSDDSICWEHKTLSGTIPDPLIPPTIPAHYRAQMEQQLMISGAERCLFHATRFDADGNCTGEAYCWYVSDMEMRNRIMQGWTQFSIDLEEYKRKLSVGEIEQTKPKLTGESIMDLPSLSVSATGMVIYSNLPEFKSAAEQYIASINTKLETDQHFADAEVTVKFCKATENKLEVTKAAILAQTASIDEVIRIVSHIQAQMRDKRLKLDKLVKSEKEQRKLALVQDAGMKYTEHVHALAAEITGINFVHLAPHLALSESIKGLKTLASMQDELDTSLANGKIEANAIAKDVRSKIAWCKEHAAGHSALFPDLQQIITKPMDDFALTITSRIEKQKAEESAASPAAVSQARPECAWPFPMKPNRAKIIEIIAAACNVKPETAEEWLLVEFSEVTA